MVLPQGNITLAHDRLAYVVCTLINQHGVVCVNLSVPLAILCMKVSFIH